MSKSASSYAEILRSTSLMGGGQVVHYLVGVLRTKVVAVLLGPAGIGLVALYVAVTGLVGTVAGLGLGTSGVRDVAEAHAGGDRARTAATVLTLRRASWFAGGLGWILLATLAWPLSTWTFGAPTEVGSLAILGSTLLFAALDAGEAAVLQGTRRIADLARRTIAQALLSAVVAVGMYAWLGTHGILAVLVMTSVANYAVSRWFSRRVELARVALSWRQTWVDSRRLVGLGVAFMWSGLLAAGTSLAIRAMIVRDLGIDASGMYQAAWSLSGLFAAFILTAMGSDFYPRLTAVAQDDSEVNKLVNQQTEIGILLALPGLLGTLAFAPWVIRVFYSSEFAAATTLLPWFVLGVFGRVTSWPMGFVLLAKGASRWFAATETVVSGIHVALAFGLMRATGLVGVATAFALLYVVYTAVIWCVAKYLTGFRWSGASVRLLLMSSALTLASFALQRYVVSEIAVVLGGALMCVATLLTLRGIGERLGADHRFVRLVCRLPGGHTLCGVCPQVRKADV